jgi:hypothetical protein
VADGLARLRINLSAREFEVEGSEAFVGTWAERFSELLDRLDLPPPAKETAAPAALPGDESFGELLHKLPRTATDVDRMLVAGHFAQMRRADRSFATGEASTLLTEQGIKVGNPSQCVKQNLLARRIFKHEGRYRVAQQGLDHLRRLLGNDRWG